MEKFYPQDQPTLLFASCLKDIFKRARQAKRDWLEGVTGDEKACQMAKDFEEELDQLAESPLDKRVDPANNRAERALRPSVVMAKNHVRK